MSKHTQYIDDYLSGELSPDKMKKFEALLEQDPELQEEYEATLKMREFLKARSVLYEMEEDPELAYAESLAEAHLRKAVEPQVSPVSSEPKPVWRSRWLIWLVPIAASIAIIFLIIRGFVLQDPNIRLYEKYYSPLERTAIEQDIVRGTSDASFQAGLDCYISEDYNCAIKNLENITEASYFLGLAYLGSGDYQAALTSLQAFHEDNPYHPGVNWYLSLSYLRMNDLDYASRYLKNLTAMENIYQVDAGKLLNRIAQLESKENND